MAKHKDSISGDQSLAEIAAQIDGKPEENEQKLTVREKRERAKKAKSFTSRWQQANYERTMKALYDEAARLAGRMERWKTEELKTRGMDAMDEFHNDINKDLFDSPFDLVDEAVRIKANIPRLRYRAEKDLTNEIYQEQFNPSRKNDPKKIAKYEAEIERIKREKMPASAFRIYEIWCIVGEIIKDHADSRMTLELSDYEDYDFEYKEEDL